MAHVLTVSNMATWLEIAPTLSLTAEEEEASEEEEAEEVMERNTRIGKGTKYYDLYGLNYCSCFNMCIKLNNY